MIIITTKQKYYFNSNSESYDTTPKTEADGIELMLSTAETLAAQNLLDQLSEGRTSENITSPDAERRDAGLKAIGELRSQLTTLESTVAGLEAQKTELQQIQAQKAKGFGGIMRSVAKRFGVATNTENNIQSVELQLASANAQKSSLESSQSAAQEDTIAENTVSKQTLLGIDQDKARAKASKQASLTRENPEELYKKFFKDTPSGRLLELKKGNMREADFSTLTANFDQQEATEIAQLKSENKWNQIQEDQIKQSYIQKRVELYNKMKRQEQSLLEQAALELKKPQLENTFARSPSTEASSN